MASAEPAVVFSSLAKLCVPAFSDGCTVEILEAEGACYRISYPRMSTEQSPNHESYPCVTPTSTAASGATFDIRTRIEAPAAAGCPAYSGMLIHTWNGPAPAAGCTAVARLLVELAVASVQRERLADLLQLTQNAVTDLGNAVVSNRQIGTALGILMVNHKITQEQAFDLLRTASQHTHRKIRDIAAEVKETGWLDVPRKPARRDQGFVPATNR